MEAKQIIQLMKETSKLGLSKMEYQKGDVKLVLENNGASTRAVPVQQTIVPAISKEAVSHTEIEEGNEKNTVKSPLVGTFYSAPAEDAPAFVTVGDTVKKGQIIGIIETMKLMNEVESTLDGIVEEILIENEQVVEFGQPLLVIR